MCRIYLLLEHTQVIIHGNHLNQVIGKPMSHLTPQNQSGLRHRADYTRVAEQGPGRLTHTARGGGLCSEETRYKTCNKARKNLTKRSENWRAVKLQRP